MATSGSIDYARTGAEIIEAALKELGVVGNGETVDSNDEADALVQLNLMIKLDQVDGVKLWRRRFAKLFTVASQASYNLPGANACDLSELSETTLDADEATSQTVLSVTSTTGFANSDVIGIRLDDDTIHWSTISSFVTDDTVTIGDALPSAAASGSEVFVYTTAAPRPLKIVSVQIEESGNEIDIHSMSRNEYSILPQKTSTGRPTQYYYDSQTGTGVLYLWPVPTDTTFEVNYDYLDSLEDIDATTETADYPQEWLSYLISNLAVRLSAQHGIEPSNATLAWAARSRNVLMAFDQEESGIEFYV